MKTLAVMLIIVFPGLVYAEPSIRFDSELHDFGTVTQGDRLECAFEFTNTGNQDLLISRLVPS